MHFLRLTNAFDGRDLIALVQRGKRETRKLTATVDVHGARAALAVIATLLRTRQMQMLAEAIKQRGARIDPQIVFLAINPKFHSDGVLRFCRKSLCYFLRTLSQCCHGRSAVASKPAMPNRERKVRRVDCPKLNRVAASGLSGVWSRSDIQPRLT